MTLIEWATKALENIELFQDVIEVTASNGVKLTRNVAKERNLAIGLINSDCAEDFYGVAKQVCPVGTVIEPYYDYDWVNLYNDKMKLAQVALTKALLDERVSKSANILMKVLEKRDRSHWADNKTVDVKTTDNQPISINIVAV